MYPTDYNRVSKPRWVTAMVTVSAIYTPLQEIMAGKDMSLIYSIGMQDFYQSVILGLHNHRKLKSSRCYRQGLRGSDYQT
jgi:hypothetical protein